VVEYHYRGGLDFTETEIAFLFPAPLRRRDILLYKILRAQPQARGVERAKITFEIAPDQAHWGVEIAGKVKAWAKALLGPTSTPGNYPRLMNAPGSETGPGPQLVTWGKSTILSVDA